MACELPKDALISKKAKTLMQKMVTQYIAFMSSEAHDFGIEANHKAITPDDHIRAFESLGATQHASNSLRLCA